MMPRQPGRVTIHMAASLDGFIAREDGRVDWMETADDYPQGETLDPATIRGFLDSIDCYVMGAGTYLTALEFEAKGRGWVYGEKPVIVLTSRDLARSQATVTFRSGDLTALFDSELRPAYRNIWVAGGGRLAGEVARLGLADEIRYSVLPVAIGEGKSFFEGLSRDVPLHLLEVKAYRSGIVALRYAMSGRPG